MREISAGELKRRLEGGEPLQILDIREAEEYRGWHIHGSRNLPTYDALRERRTDPLVGGAENLPRDRPIVTVCRAGIVSRVAASILADLGFDAASLTGGMRGFGHVWTEARLARLERPDAVAIQVRRNGKGCLSYVLGSRGEAAVVDPAIDPEAFLGIARREGLRITTVLETHVHADHLSRARALAGATGAELVLPANDRVRFPFRPVRDGDRLRVGKLEVEVVATPGHTGESVSYRVDGTLLLTGDTLFLDAVGRPDLERGDAGAEEGAVALWGSLRRLLGSPFRGSWVLPAHHAGPIGFDGRPLEAELDALPDRLELLGTDEPTFVRRVVGRLGVKPPNYETVLAVNEGRLDPDRVVPEDLEAGPNRCAAG